MSLLDVFMAALATWQIIEIWHHSNMSWLAQARDLVERKGWFLFQCPFCLSPWVAGIVVILLAPGIWPVGIVAYVFGIARLANLGNDLAHKWNRTPKIGVLPDGSQQPDTPTPDPSSNL